MIKKLAFIMIVAIGFTTIAEAQTRTPGVTSKQIVQHKRIKHGVRNGQLTRREARKLRAQQRHIQRTKRRMKSDGKITPRERAVLSKKQQRASRNVYRKKHNGITR